LRELKVGLLVLGALLALAIGIFFVGQENQLFGRKNEYFVHFKSVEGLATGNPVQLDGVNVGHVQRIVLPEAVDESFLTVWVSVDRSYAQRIREDSQARIQTLGLLGDKYIQLSSGSPEATVLPDGGQIPAAPGTEIDALLASGGSAMDNLVAISASLRNILARMESGEGVLGELTTESPTGQEIRSKILNILGSAERISQGIETGEGTLGRLVRDESLAREVEAALKGFSTALGQLHDGDGVLPALLTDAGMRDRFRETLTNLSTASERLSVLAEELQDGDGLLAKLLADDEYGDKVAADVAELVERMNSVAGKIDEGRGSLGALINDPSITEAVNDIIVGINESKFLRWLVRNRQKKGIEARYEDNRDDAAAGPEE
jgi:phospholipid/cholesterol/gamma-HCH transport system substrate-binding protein